MTETLFIRLGSQSQDTIHWLIVNDAKGDEQTVIASGELQGAQQLSELTSKAESRPVKVLVPGCDVLLKSLKVPSKSTRARRQAVPYMLEDSFAEDVEKLFFAYADLPKDIQGNNCFAAIVSHSQMEQWLSWLSAASISTSTMLPDVLAMPYTEKGWSAIALGNEPSTQVIARQHLWQGFTLDASTWQLQCQAFSQNHSDDDEESDNLVSVHLEAYSPLAYSELFNVEHMPEELPLALMAKHYNNKLNRFNLLQGKYKIKEVKSYSGSHWLWVAGVALFALLLNIGEKTTHLWQLSAEEERVEQSIIAEYKKVFPKTKRVRLSTIKSQLNRELALLGGGSNEGGFLSMLAQVQPSFAQVPELKPESLKFDGKRQELRVQAIAKDYQSFEKFSNGLAKTNFTVKQGSQSNQGDQVTGSFSITNQAKKSSSKKRSNKRSKGTS